MKRNIAFIILSNLLSLNAYSVLASDLDIHDNNTSKKTHNQTTIIPETNQPINITTINADINHNNIEQIVQLFKQAKTTNPNNINLLSYLAVWTNFNGNNIASIKLMAELAKLNPQRQADIEHLINTVDHIIATPLKNQPIKNNHNNIAIITSGENLTANGSMTSLTIERLTMTLQIAKSEPNTLIIVTSEHSKQPQITTTLMTQWLITHGIAPKRIISSQPANNMIEQTLHSSHILAHHKIDHATLITSATTARYTQILFDIASWQTGPQGISFDSIAISDHDLFDLKKPTTNELINIYRDALQIYEA